MERARRHIIIGGGSGFIGAALTDALRERGERVTWISRTSGKDRMTWDELAQNGLPECDVVINFAGQHILDVRRKWNDAYRDEVINSRIETTKTLVEAINKMQTPPKTFISTAGKCFYGTKEMADGEAYPELDETSSPMGMDFPAELVSQWEAAAEHVDTSRVRHIQLRIGVVLGAIQRKSYIGKLWRIGKARGFLPIIRLPFCLGLGAIIGSGKQLFPWIHLDDMTGILLHVIDNTHLTGRYNAVSPGIVNNHDFTQSFAKYLKRPIRWSVPAWVIKRIVGEERSSILLKGQLVRPKRTLESGYKFKFPTIDDAMNNLVKITF